MTPFDVIRELYPRFLDCGYSPLLFWQLSTAEVVDMLESHYRQQERKRQQDRCQQRDEVTILDGFGMILLNNLFLREGDQPVHLQEVFPALFQQEQKEDIGKQAADMEVYKAERLYHAYCFNQSRKGRS